MQRTIDCLFIGHNDINFADYEKSIRGMGCHSGAYRDLNLNFIRCNDKPYTASEIFNLFYCSNKNGKSSRKPLLTGDTFSAAIAYLGTYLHRRGFSFDYVNSFQEEKEELVEKLRQENILTIAVITTLYTSVLPILEIMEVIRKNNRTAKIILGGPFIHTQVRILSQVSLEYLFGTTIGADYYVDSSQGEAALTAIISSLKNNKPLSSIPNIYYKNNGGYLATPKVRENNPLKENMVNWDLFSPSVGEVVNVRTSISCPFSCSFCGFPERAGKHQTVPARLIIRQLKSLETIYTVKMVNFIDDTFNVPGERFKELLGMMIKHRTRLPWTSNFRCQFADRETVSLMKESGCEGVFLGIESGNNQILKNMNKRALVEKYLEGIALLKEFEILTMGSFIIGFPGETYETIQDTLGFIKESNIDFFQVQLWYCEPITPIWEQKDKYNLEGESFEWSHKTMDSKLASHRVEEIFLSVETPIYVPQYHFDYTKIWFLKHRGITLDQVKDFLRAFNRGIKQKLTEPAKPEIDIEVIKQLKDALRQDHDVENFFNERTDALTTDDIQFNF
ncbi:MAG: PhpK family radical SAM P-methyltransferase [Candidatus Aminicenantes bacterium]|nr:MAG: PhpK family radical SAM P-methyltransferase [Candidatus Aminicenantes bacterium]